jgi:hypothetical protein
MARFTFRHGIARRQEDGLGNPTFLQKTSAGAYIDLIVSPDPTIFLIAHYDTDYLLIENNTVPHAWGPFTAGVDYWLYWDVDFETGALTRGYTLREPIDQPRAPTSPLPDQHWFDTQNKVMKVWSGNRWVDYLRVFACKYQQGSIIVHSGIGSQVGMNNVPTNAGAILFDPEDKPVQKFKKDRRGQFITTETPLFSQFIRLANFRIEASIFHAKADENIPAHFAVAYTDYNKIKLARNDVPQFPAVGIAAEDMERDEVRAFIASGFVQDDVLWNWSNYSAGTPLFVGLTGELTPNPPQQWSIQRVGIVVDPKTVYVDVKQIILYG